MNVRSKLSLYLSSAILSVALVLGAFALPGCAKKAGPAATAPVALPVTVVKARRGTISERLVLTGSVAPKQQANLSSVATGQILAVNANVGDSVSAGEVLVKIDDSTLRAQLAQNQSNLTQAQAKLAQTMSGDVGNVSSAGANLLSARVAYNTAVANLQRNQQLLKQGYVSQATVDQAQQAVAAAQAQLRGAEVAAQNANLNGQGQSSEAQSEIKSLQAAVAQAQAAVEMTDTQIAQTVIRAPFDGILTQRSVDPGALASPGTPLVQVSQLDPVYVNIGIPEEDLPYIHAGTEVEVKVETLAGRVWHGTVAAVNAATTQGTLSYMARIVLANHDAVLRAGMVATGAFVKAERRGVVLVPRASLFQGDNGDAVYVLDTSRPCAKCDGRAKSVTVRRGLQTENQVEVQSPGIAAGTSIIVERPDQLRDGSLVTVSSAGGQTSYSSQSLP